MTDTTSVLVEASKVQRRCIVIGCFTAARWTVWPAPDQHAVPFWYCVDHLEDRIGLYERTSRPITWTTGALRLLESSGTDAARVLLEGVALARLQAEHPGWKLWRGRAADGTPRSWMGTRLDPDAGVDPTIGANTIEGLRAELAGQLRRAQRGVRPLLVSPGGYRYGGGR